jgi:HEAT repeat protein
MECKREVEELACEKRIEKLVSRLSSCDVSKRYHAAEMLASMGPRAKPAFAQLRKALQEEENACVRKSFVFALGALGVSDGREDLSEVARSDDDKFVRQCAEEALQSLSEACKIVSL